MSRILTEEERKARLDQSKHSWTWGFSDTKHPPSKGKSSSNQAKPNHAGAKPNNKRGHRGKGRGKASG